MRRCIDPALEAILVDPVRFLKVGSMEEASQLESALDCFTGLCSLGDLAKGSVEPSDDTSPWDARIKGTAVWNRTEYRLEIWAGFRDWTPKAMAAGTSVWLSLEGETFDLSTGGKGQIDRMVPKEFASGMAAAVNQLTALLRACLSALHSAASKAERDYALEQMKLAAGTIRSNWEYEADAVIAQSDLLENCSNTLLSRVCIRESGNVHLAFDVTAVTLDPCTGDETGIGIGWMKSEDSGSTHSFRIGTAECLAHEDDEVERLLDTVPEASRGHYLHAFNHLHQIAHAADNYANAQTRLAIAEAGTAQDPLLAVERHDAAHVVHSGLAEKLTAYALEVSSEPDPPHA